MDYELTKEARDEKEIQRLKFIAGTNWKADWLTKRLKNKGEDNGSHRKTGPILRQGKRETSHS